MNRSIVTPFNTFCAGSFVLLVTVWILSKNDLVNRVALAAASALLGFLLIGSFLVWTLFQRE